MKIKKREYRIAYREGYNEYYPQTRRKLFGIPITRWLNISERSGSDFGLYNTFKYPKETLEEAKSVIWNYRKREDFDDEIKYLEYDKNLFIQK